MNEADPSGEAESDGGPGDPALVVVGDSVPGGGGPEGDPAWPAMVADRLGLTPEGVVVDARTARTICHVRDYLGEILDDALPGDHPLGGPDAGAPAGPGAGAGTDDGGVAADLDRGDGAARSTVVLVHAGHNDPQSTADGGPRTGPEEFLGAVEDVDDALGAAPVADHAVVEPVPLVRFDRPGTVPMDDPTPDRAHRYAGRLRETLPADRVVALGVDAAAWRPLSADGVHPTANGHELLADRVTDWLRGR